MISLSEVEDRVRSLTEHYPTQQDYRSQIKEIISTAQEVIWTERDWNFKYKERELRIYPDITSTTSNSQTIAATHMQRNITFSASVPELGYGYYHKDWVGQVLEIGGRDYPILNIVSATSVILEEPYQGSNLTASTDWKFKHRYYLLPEDCERLVAYTSMDKPFPAGLSSRADIGTAISSHMHPVYDQDETADYADTIFRAEDLRIPPAGKMLVSWTTGTTGAIPVNEWYEFAWSFYYQGRYGPLSKSYITKSTGGALNNATLLCYDHNTEAIIGPSVDYATTPYRTKWEGLQKVFWYNANTNRAATSEKDVKLGKPVWMPIYNPSSAGQTEYQRLSIESTSYNAAVTEMAQLHSSDNSMLAPGGAQGKVATRYRPHNIQRIQPWPRVNRTDATYAAGTSPTSPAQAYTADIIKYLATPPEMLLDTDAMSLPPAFLNLLIYKSLHGVFTKLGNSDMTKHYGALYEIELARLERTYASNKQLYLTNGRWSNRNFSYRSLLSNARRITFSG